MAAILGHGAVSSLGVGSARIWSAMIEGRDGIAEIRRFTPTAFPLGALVPGRDDTGGASLCTELAITAAREAWERARPDAAPDRIALVVGTSLGEAGVRVHDITRAVAGALGITGPQLTVSTACASSANAIGLALDLLALDAADVVIAGGTDVLTPLVHAGFAALGVLGEAKCAPFSEPPGTTLGEGAGFLVLGKGDAPLHVTGYGISTDAYHDTGPDPTGAGVARALGSALAHAGVAPAAVDYVNAHGTGTRANDPAEWRAIKQTLGPDVPVSASKSFLGHAQGAAGVLETIATLVAMEQGRIPPTQRYTTPRPNTPGDAVGGATARAARCEVAVKTSAGFGGANCALVLGRRPTAPARERRPIYLAAVAEGCDDFSNIPADPRGVDRQTRLVTTAVARALAAAGIVLRGAARDRTGLVAGLDESSRESDAGLRASIAEHGYRGLSANLFARQVLNAAPGTCARLLGIRGAHSVIAAGDATGLAALVYGAELLATRPELDAVAVVGADETAGAICHVLATRGTRRLAGWGIGRDAAGRACAMAMSCPVTTAAPGVLPGLPGHAAVVTAGDFALVIGGPDEC